MTDTPSFGRRDFPRVQQEKADLLALLYAFDGEGWMVTAPIQLPAEP